jgi:uncharacterized protein YndB with AHSA1/START domain
MHLSIEEEINMKPTVTHATFTIQRSYPTAPERVFAAFADPEKKRRWYGGAEGRTAEVFEMDFKVGGNDKTQTRLGPNTPFPGVAMTNHTTYQDIQPNRRIVFAYTMTIGDCRISASLATVEFLATDKGTDLVFTEQGAFFENSDGPERREAGWNHLLDNMAAEVK